MDESRLDEHQSDASVAGTAEGCGCIAVAPRSESEQLGHPPPPTDPAARTDDASAPLAESPRRSLKLVVTLRPANAGGYHAILALGSDGCDPLFRALDAPDLPTVLAEVPALLAAAHESWRAEPPNTAPRSAKAQSRNASEAPPIPAASAPATSEEPPHSPNVAPALAAAKPSSGQLPLFG